MECSTQTSSFVAARACALGHYETNCETDWSDSERVKHLSMLRLVFVKWCQKPCCVAAAARSLKDVKTSAILLVDARAFVGAAACAATSSLFFDYM